MQAESSDFILNPVSVNQLSNNWAQGYAGLSVYSSLLGHLPCLERGGRLKGIVPQLDMEIHPFLSFDVICGVVFGYRISKAWLVV